MEAALANTKVSLMSTVRRPAVSAVGGPHPHHHQQHAEISAVQAALTAQEDCLCFVTCLSSEDAMVVTLLTMQDIARKCATSAKWKISKTDTDFLKKDKNDSCTKKITTVSTIQTI